MGIRMSLRAAVLVAFGVVLTMGCVLKKPPDTTVIKSLALPIGGRACPVDGH